MSEAAHEIADHFFRHESANMIAVLTRAFGVRRIELIEDMVQSALLEAMHVWKQKGVPENPAGWVHRVARNRILDVLRREKIHEKALAFTGQTAASSEALIDRWLEADQLPDSLLRMMFVCCHPSLDRPSQIALTLKTLCGFSIGEIARGLLTTVEGTGKRIQRARASLAEQRISLDPPTGEAMRDRLHAVHDVLYLIFNEGYDASRGDDPIREDLCEESARLCHLLCEREGLSTPTTRALLALMLFHAARFDARRDAAGDVVLLEDQDRTLWDRNLICVAESWLARSRTDALSHFHLEAAIAQQHCRAGSVESTDWAMIVRLYDRLIAMHDSPLYVLNRAIARGQTGDVPTALDELESLRNRREMSNYYLLDCAQARLHEMVGDGEAAVACYRLALAHDLPAHQRSLLERRVQGLTRWPDETREPT